MPGSTTTRLALYKPDPTGVDFVNVVTDINNNADNLDAKMGWVACTSGTRPGSPFNGQGIRETDTSKYYIWNGAAWIQALVGTAQFGAIQDLGAQTIMRDRITMNRRPATRRSAPSCGSTAGSSGGRAGLPRLTRRSTGVRSAL